MRVVAPHLVRKLPFLFPLYEDGPYRPWFVQSGIIVYSTLARAKLNGLVEIDRAQKLVPELRADGLRSCALYEDAWTNDGRLTLANLRGAADRGATVVNGAEVVGVRPLEVRVDGQVVAVRAKQVVNAAGPWVDDVRRLEDPQAKPSMRLSKGVHVVVDGGESWGAALTIPHDKVRVSFAVPWEGMLLLGTTDTEYTGPPGDVSVSDTDVAQVLDEARVALDTIGPPRATFAGLRVLPGGDGGTASAKRETVFSTGPTGMVSVAGGKLTTYRRIALDALGHAGVRGLSRRPRPLPGATGLDRIAWPVELDSATRAHLLHLYGSLAVEVLAPAVEDPSLLEPIVAGRPDLRAQDLYARTHEWARSDEDVVRRRTTAWLAGSRLPV
jgi:glycerol-3-phosphate dehydrogenase